MTNNKSLLFVLLYPLMALPSLPHAHAEITTTLKPDSAKECALCHYEWVDTFFFERRGTPLVPFPEKPTVATSEMCFSCHDGSTVDSRKKVYNDRKHQVGTIPSEKIKIPEIFPLDEEGKMACATCHSAHGVSTEPGIERTIFLRTSNENSEMCKTCHVDKLGGPEKGNHPIDKTTLPIPLELVRHGGYIGNEPNQIICESCHVAHGGFTEKRLVLPVDHSIPALSLCESCHGTTPSLNKDKNLTRYSHSVGIVPEKAQVPEIWKNGTVLTLGRERELLCVTCHSPHQPAVNKSLLVERNERDSLCVQCHADQERAIRGTKHDLLLMAPAAKNILGKTALESGPCSCCHLTHEGVGPFMWARKWEGKEAPAVGICKSCHEQGKCAENVPVPPTGHPVGVSPKDPHAPMELPLFTPTGQKNTKGSIFCSSCHNTHQWDPVDPHNKGSKEVKGNITNSFLRTTQQESLLCLSCHKEQAAIVKTDHDLSLSAPSDKNIIDQSPEESGVCGSCHLAHGGAELFMWARKLEGENGSPMVQLCLECHSQAGCAQKKQVGEHSHPIEVSLKTPVEISLPLYLPESPTDSKGMVFCSTCHNPHQWKPGEPETKGDEGSSSDSFLRLTADGNSPLCSECHQHQSLIEGTEHDLRFSAPEERNAQELLSRDSGLCGPCHAIHNAPVQPFIWNREIGPSTAPRWRETFALPQNLPVGLCTSCHLEGKCAQDKIPEFGLHPPQLYMALLKGRTELMNKEEYEQFIDLFPIYTQEGAKSVEGNIVCSTCHEPHCWDAYRPQKGTGVKIEGDATTSFLRKDISSTFCASCHGEEGLYKFKYFHTLKGRKKEKPAPME